jgi:hypothetical protein
VREFSHKINQINNMQVYMATVDSETTILEVKYTPPAAKTDDYRQILPLLALDISASMGSCLQAAVKSVRELAQVYLEHGCPEVWVCCYNHQVTRFVFKSVQDLQSFNPQASNSTNFSCVLQELTVGLDWAIKQNREARIYFMTDGCNTVSGNKLPNALNLFSEKIQTMPTPATVDVIGFTDYHDVDLLNNIAQTVIAGTFQFADSEEALTNIIKQLLSVSKNKLVFDVNFGFKTARIVAVLNDHGEYCATYKLGCLCPKELRIVVNGVNHICPVVFQKLNKTLRQQLLIGEIRNQLQKLVQRVNILYSGVERALFDQDLRDVDHQIDNLVVNADWFRDYTLEQRRTLKEAHLEFKSLVSFLYSAREKALTTSERATMLTMSSSYLTKVRKTS